MLFRDLAKVLYAFALATSLLVSQGLAADSFGSELSPDLLPTLRRNSDAFCSNLTDPNPHPNCTWVMNGGFGGCCTDQAPKDGRIGRIFLMSCSPGQFRLETVRIGGGQGYVLGRLVTRGPIITFKGDPNKCASPPYLIESFRVRPPLPISQGLYLAIETPQAVTLFCPEHYTFPNTFKFAPPVRNANQPPRVTRDYDKCNLLIRAVYNR